MWSIVRIKLEGSNADSKGFCSPALTPAACPSPPCCSDRSERSELGRRTALEEKWENALKLKGRNVSGKITVLRMGRSTRPEAQMFCSHQSRNYFFTHITRSAKCITTIHNYVQLNKRRPLFHDVLKTEWKNCCMCSITYSKDRSILYSFVRRALLCTLYHSSKTLSYVNLL